MWHWEDGVWIGILAGFSLLRTVRGFGGPDLVAWFYVPALLLAALAFWRWRSRRSS